MGSSFQSEFQFSSVAQLYPNLCDPMDCSMPGFPAHHQLPELTQLMSIESVMPSNHPILCCSLLFPPSSFPASGSFPMSQLFTSGGQSIGVSASATVLPLNIQDLFPLGQTGWISLQSKELQGVFSNTTVQKHQFFSAQLSLVNLFPYNKVNLLPYNTLISFYLPMCCPVFQLLLFQ